MVFTSTFTYNIVLYFFAMLQTLPVISVMWMPSVTCHRNPVLVAQVTWVMEYSTVHKVGVILQLV